MGQKSHRTPLVDGLLIAFLVSGLNLASCSFDKPSAPSWDVEVTIPLISKVYTMKEIAEDESSVGVDSTGLLFLELESELDRYYVGNQLTLNPTQEVFQSELGSFSVDSPGSQSTFSTLREIFPQADAFQGQMVIVPPFSFSTDKKSLDPFQEFAFVVIDTGNVRIHVVNNLPVPLGRPLTFEIWDTRADTLIINQTRDVQVQPGESRDFLVELGNHRFANALSVRISGQSPGSLGNPVLVDANSQFEVVAQISDLLVSEAQAKIPAQEVSSVEEVSISDSLVIKEAHIEQGQVVITVGGRFPLDAWVTYRIPDLISASGNALMDSVFIARGTSTVFSIDLSGYTFKPEWADFGQQKLNFLWTVRTEDTGANEVLVTSRDFVRAEINFNGIEFSQVSGKIGKKQIEIKQTEFQFDIPTDLDSVFFQSARLELIVNNGINFPARTNLRIEGRSGSGQVAELDVRANIQPASAPGVPVSSVIVLDRQNSNIEQFISILPSLIRVFGAVELGDESWIGTVSKNDYVSGLVRIQAPMAVSLPPQTIESDVNSVEIDEGTRNDVEKNLSSGSFYAEIANHLPLGASAEFVFAQIDSMVFQNPILKIGPVAVDGAGVDQSGFVVSPVNSEIEVKLSEQEMRTFLKSPLFVGLRVRLDGTNGQVVKIRGSDFVQVKSYGKIRMKINQN